MISQGQFLRFFSASASGSFPSFVPYFVPATAATQHFFNRISRFLEAFYDQILVMRLVVSTKFYVYKPAELVITTRCGTIFSAKYPDIRQVFFFEGWSFTSGFWFRPIPGLRTQLAGPCLIETPDPSATENSRTVFI
jgi:hypothetical protein